MVEKFLNLNFLESIGLIAIEAGKSVMDVYAEDFDIKEKKPNHPVTKADIKSHLIIKKKLENKLPNTHFFSEESNYVTWDKRQKWKKLLVSRSTRWHKRIHKIEMTNLL